MSEDAPKRPLLRHFGGKWQMGNWIVSRLPDHHQYAEPFAGAASVLLRKPKCAGPEILNDLNDEIMNVFRVVRDPSDFRELAHLLDWTPFAKAEFDECEDRGRHLAPVERARRTIVRSFMGIEVSGIGGRKKTSMRMNAVPLGRLDKAGKPTYRDCGKDWENWKVALPVIRDRLRGVTLHENDAIDFIGMMSSPDCLLYIDPPYDHATRSSTRYAVEFDDHPALVEALLETRSMVVLSGYQTEAYAPLEDAGWHVERRKSRANMSENPREEVLWISPNAEGVAA